MSLFQSKWAAQILLENKRIFNLDHEASEQEVHEHLRNVQSYEDVTAAAAAAGKEDLDDAKQAITALQAEKEALENRLKEADSQVASLQANVAQLKKDAEALQTDLDAKVAEIAALKAEPAALHTGGETEPTPAKGERAYEKNPLYQKAKSFRRPQAA